MISNDHRFCIYKNFGFNTMGSHGWVNMEEYGSSGIIRNYLF